MATSPNYGWSEPDNTSLVKDGALAIRTLGNAIDAFLYRPFTSNGVINSAMQIAQRGTTFTSTNILYTLDRWQATRYGTTGGTVSQQLTSDTTNLPQIQYCIRVANDPGVTSSGTYIYNTFENADSTQFIGQTVTFSFYARKGATYSGGSITANLVGGTGTDQNLYNGFTGQTTQLTTSPTLTTTWTRYSVTGTIGASFKQLGISILIQGTGTAGATDFAEITGVQVEVGNQASPFQTASGGSIQGELAMCQRYYLLGSTINYPATSTNTFSNQYTGYFPVTMRGTPTITINAAITNTANNVYDGPASTDRAATVELQQTQTFGIFLTAAPAAVGNWLRFLFTASAEL